MIEKNRHVLNRVLRVLVVLALCLGAILSARQHVGTESSVIPTSSNAISINSILSGNTPNNLSGYSGNQSNSVSFPNPRTITTPTSISIGNISNSSSISPLDYGANVVWYDGGYGVQNLATNQFYSDIVNLTKSIGISALRYPGGIPSDTFNWQNAIGPQSTRKNDVVYQQQDVYLPTTFGPDEFAQFAQEVGAATDITVNFGTGTAQQAADWVQYMTASSTTNYWGKLRAKNGHPAPYNVPYWEVGNEQESSSGENYWRSGTEVSIGNGKVNCKSNDLHMCEYVYGGVTAFTKQPALGAANTTVGNGLNSQVFYAKYPPVETGSQTVYVNGQLWHQVNDISLATAGEHAYELNNTTGQITFGNGVHGAVVPSHATVTISYQSGPHDGFIQYYKLMKAADPNAQICSSYDATVFIQIMGSTNPYDCLVVHFYAGNVISTNASTLLFHNSVMDQSYNFAGILSGVRSTINKYAGAAAKKISIAVTEYGVNAQTSPNGQPNYHRSQDMALFTANILKAIIEAHVPIAERHFLVSYENSQPPGVQDYVNSSEFADNALIAGPGPNAILQPSAYVFQAYTKYMYSNLIASKVINNPTIVYSGGNYPALSTVATTNRKGQEAIMVINTSGTNSVTAQIKPYQSNFKHVKAWTLGSSSYLAYNTLSSPNTVGFVKTTGSLTNGKIIASFPAGSITVLQLSK